MPTGAPGSRARACVRGVWLCALAITLCGCSKSLDADLWDCQFAVQSDNAGHSSVDNADRAQSIAACMTARGYKLDARKPTCKPGTVTAQCYLK
jgi:hypothetical protein